MSMCLATKFALVTAGGIGIVGLASNLTSKAEVATGKAADIVGSADIIAAWERNGMIGVLLLMVTALAIYSVRKEIAADRKRDKKEAADAEYKRARMEQDAKHHKEIIAALNYQTTAIERNAARCEAVRELALASLARGRIKSTADKEPQQ